MIFLYWNRVISISILVFAFCRYVKNKEAQDKINLPRKIELQIFLQEKEKNWAKCRKLPPPYHGKSEVCLQCSLSVECNICKNFMVLQHTGPAQKQATMRHKWQESSLFRGVVCMKYNQGLCETFCSYLLVLIRLAYWFYQRWRHRRGANSLHHRMATKSTCGNQQQCCPSTAAFFPVNFATRQFLEWTHPQRMHFFFCYPSGWKPAWISVSSPAVPSSLVSEHV